MPGIPYNCQQINISNTWKELKAPRIVTTGLNPCKTKEFSNFDSELKFDSKLQELYCNLTVFENRQSHVWMKIFEL